jgi:L-asparaginase/beta-aspartyl-peptidase (threonine type)
MVAALEAGEEAFEAARLGTRLLEDDPRFNAGTGANLLLDGKTIQMDAAIMACDGRFGAVACIESVQHPIDVATQVVQTPHLLLVGPGATAFARKHGFGPHDPITPKATQGYVGAWPKLRQGAGPWSLDLVRTHWNFESPFPEDPGPNAGCDTVGVVVRDQQGRTACTSSTGGIRYMLRGRVGDSPIPGCGLYCAPAVAAAATGIGEAIIQRFASLRTCEWMQAGASSTEAVERAVDLFPTEIAFGVIALDEAGGASACNRDMAWAMMSG